MLPGPSFRDGAREEPRYAIKLRIPVESAAETPLSQHKPLLLNEKPGSLNLPHTWVHKHLYTVQGWLRGFQGPVKRQYEP